MPLPSAPDTLLVADVVPSTIVGDGPLAGWRCATIRLGGCNLACTWCDVPHTWDGARVDLSRTLRQRPLHAVLEDVLEEFPRLVLITGGEPLLQQATPAWRTLLTTLRAEGIELEVHTNGTLVPERATVEPVHRFVVSPKLSHSGEPTWTRIRPDALQAWAELAIDGKVAFSFVVRDRVDVQTVASLASVHGLPRDLVWISPEGTTAARVLDVTAEVAEATISHGFSLATRIGVLADVRGYALA